MSITSPIGRTAAEGSGQRARRNTVYRAEQARVATYENIARQIIKLRIDHDLTQEELATRVGTTKGAISRLESGRHASTVESLRKIAWAFGGQLQIGFGVAPSKPEKASSRTRARQFRDTMR